MHRARWGSRRTTADRDTKGRALPALAVFILLASLLASLLAAGSLGLVAGPLVSLFGSAPNAEAAASNTHRRPMWEVSVTNITRG